MFRWIFAFLFFSVQLAYSGSSVPRLTSETEPLATFYGCINVISGDFFEVETELVVPGPEPLSVTRMYDSGHRFESPFGIGIGLAFPAHIEATTEIKQKRAYLEKAFLEERQGMFLPYLVSYGRGGIKAKIDPQTYKSGYSNYSPNEISARTNIKNVQMTYSNFQDGMKAGTWTYQNGIGEIRTYSPSPSDSYKFNIREEIKPNGNRVCYQFDEKDRIKRIVTYNNKKTVLLGSLDFSYSKYKCKVKGSNGLEVCYNIVNNVSRVRSSEKKKKEAPYYNDEQDPNNDDGYGYEQQDDNEETKKTKKKVHHNVMKRMSASHLPDIWYEVPNYADQKTICKYKEVHRPRHRSMYIGYNKEGRVGYLKEPITHKKDRYTSYRFKYYASDTEVFDVYNNLTVYHFDKETRRIKIIRKYDQRNKVIAHHFYWDNEGKLIAKANYRKQKNIFNSKYYHYDARGNVIKEELFGNFTGKAPKTFQLNYKTLRPATKTDSYAVTRTYSKDRFNLLLSEIYPYGVTIKYSYKPGTNLLTSKLTIANGTVQKREFYTYDDHATLVSQIFDDGSGTKVANLENVVTRKIIRITPVPPGTNGFGLPHVVTESYLDIPSGCERMLKKMVNTYIKSGLLIRQDVYDANNKLQYSLHKKYNDHQLVIEETNALGEVTRYEYDANDNKTFEQKVGSGKSIHYTYDFMNRLIVEEEKNDSGLCLKKRYIYNKVGNLIRSYDWHDNETHYRYDGLNRCTRIQDSLKQREVNTYDPLGNVIAKTNKNGNTTHFEYNAYGKPILITHPDGSQERFEYTTNGWLAKKVEKNGTYTTYAHDYQGRAFEANTYAQGTCLRTVKKQYKSDLLISETDAKGIITKYHYDGAGRKITQIKGESKIAYEYDSLGRTKKTYVWFEKDAYTVTINEYDLLDRTIEKRIEDNSGKLLSKETYTYDVQGNKNLIRIYTSENEYAQQKMYYDPQGNLTLKVDPLGYHTHYSYSYGKTLQITKTDALGQITQQTYDIFGRVSHIETRNPYGQVIAEKSIAYSPTGKKISEIHSRFIGKTKVGTYRTDWQYDNMGKVLKKNEQPGLNPHKITSYAYDLTGKLKILTKPDGVQLFYSYDPLGRLSALTSSNKSIHYTYRYDLNDNVLEVIDQKNGQTNSRSYDNLDRLTQETLGNGLTLQYEHDQIGRIKQLKLPDRTNICYEYDSLNLSSITRKDENEQEKYRHRYLKTDLDGKTLHSQLANGTETFHQWDPLGRNVSIKSKHWEQNIPPDGLDAVGNLQFLNLRDSFGDTQADYQHDSLYQITKETGTATHTYTNDSINNRLSKDGTNVLINCHNQIYNDGYYAYTYDYNGNMLTKKGKDYQVLYRYDALNRMVSAEKSNDFKAKYTYDSFGRRLSKKVYHWNNKWDLKEDQRYLYHGNHEIGAVDANDQIVQLKVIGRKKASALAISVAIELNGDVYVPIHDHRGNICCLLDKNGNAAETIRYSAYGEEKTQGNVNTPWRFASKRIDLETGLVLFGKRYYDPFIGRWTTPDPAGFIDGPNLYAYVHNNPMMNIDIFGLATESATARPEGFWDTATSWVSNSVKSIYSGTKSLFRAGTSYLGRGLEMTGKYLGAVPGQGFINGAGRWLQGKSFWPGTNTGVIAGEKLPGQTLGCNPGIMTTEKTSINIAEVIVDGKIQAHYMNHETGGFWHDIWQVIKMRCFGPTRSVYELADWITQEYERLSKETDNPLIHILAHSRGAEELYMAGKLLPEHIRQSVHAYAFGPSHFIPKDMFKEAYNYINKNDIVPTFSPISRFDSRVNVIETGFTHGGITSLITDHFWTSEGYLKRSQEIIANIKEGN